MTKTKNFKKGFIAVSIINGIILVGGGLIVNSVIKNKDKKNNTLNAENNTLNAKNNTLNTENKELQENYRKLTNLKIEVCKILYPNNTDISKHTDKTILNDIKELCKIKELYEKEESNNIIKSLSDILIFYNKGPIKNYAATISRLDVLKKDLKSSTFSEKQKKDLENILRYVETLVVNVKLLNDELTKIHEGDK